jgi:hypothetical protein
MPPALRRQVEAAAKSSFRNLNGEIVFRLMSTFKPQPSDKRRIDAGRPS